MISGLLSLAGAAILVVIDQLIKHWATAALLPVGNMDLLPGIVELRYCLNDGMAFSMLAGKQTLLIGMTSVMLVVVAAMLFTRKMSVWERISWTLILAAVWATSSTGYSTAWWWTTSMCCSCGLPSSILRTSASVSASAC